LLEPRIRALPELPIGALLAAWTAAWDAPPAKGARRRLLMLGRHMGQHMLAGFGRDRMDGSRTFFLIREPVRVTASFAAKREPMEREDLGFDRQARVLPRRHPLPDSCLPGVTRAR
jgi:hypothetical protein